MISRVIAKNVGDVFLRHSVEECRLSFITEFISNRINSKSRILSLKLYQTKSVSRISTTITETMEVWYDNLVMGRKRISD